MWKNMKSEDKRNANITYSTESAMKKISNINY